MRESRLIVFCAAFLLCATCMAKPAFAEALACFHSTPGWKDVGFGGKAQVLSYSNDCLEDVYFGFIEVSHGQNKGRVQKALAREVDHVLAGADDGATISYVGSCYAKQRDCYKSLTNQTSLPK